jgi:hypothetical protein
VLDVAKVLGQCGGRVRHCISVIAGLDPQVGYTRLAAPYLCADLGQARGPVQSIHLVRMTYHE